MDNTNQNKIQINDLPLEMLAKIFYELGDIKQLCSVLTKVCKLWKAVAISSPTLWTKVHLTSNDLLKCLWVKDLDISTCFTFIKDFSLVHDQAFVSDYDTSFCLDMIIRNCSHLEKFMCFSSVRFLPFPCINTLPQLCPLITEFHFDNVKFPENSNMLPNLIEYYGANLIKLVLRNVQFEPHTVLELSQKIGKYCTGLVHLKIDLRLAKHYLDSFDWNAVQLGCRNMEELVVKSVSLLESEYSGSCFSSLKKFSFDRTSRGIQAGNILDQLNDVLCGSKNLEKLKLMDVVLSEDMETRLLNLPFNNLKKLSLMCFGFDEELGLYNVLCKWKQSLIKLTISCKRYVINSIFQYIEDHGKHTLEFFSLSANGFDIEHLKELISQCEKLQCLKLPFQKVTLSNRMEINEWIHS